MKGKRMLIEDAVYGTHHIHEPVLIATRHSAALQRLQGIHQGGAAFLVRARRDVSRYEHSVGVMLLIRMLGGSVQEQLAGLLHDVSHTAFSHVVDYALSNHTEDFHEQHFESIMERFAVPALLQRYGISMTDILPVDQWPLLEQEMPDLCADRIDYTLRDLLHIGYIDNPSIQRFLSQLQAHEGKIVCRSLDAALWFTEQYARLILELFLHPVELFASQQLAEALRIALTNGILQENDLFLQDDALLTRLQAAHHPDIARHLAYLHPALQVEEDTTGTAKKASIKARLVDPPVLQPDGRVMRCSELAPAIQALQTTMKQKAIDGVCLKVITHL
jgi:HD superfamily phosphohydrolase